MSSNSVILVRVYNGIGIDAKANGYLLDGTPVKRRVYNGRLCYQHNNIRLGYNTLRNAKPVEIVIDNPLPF